MKYFRLFDISDFAIDDDFIRWVHNKRKADNDLTEARHILELLGTEQKMISEEERQWEIERLCRRLRRVKLNLRYVPIHLIFICWWQGLVTERD